MKGDRFGSVHLAVPAGRSAVVCAGDDISSYFYDRCIPFFMLALIHGT